MRNDGDYTCHIWMWITYSRVSKSYQTVLIWTRGKYENQTSGNVLWKREEMSKGQSNKTERNKTDFSNTNRILSVVCRNYTMVDRGILPNKQNRIRCTPMHCLPVYKQQNIRYGKRKE